MKLDALAGLLGRVGAFGILSALQGGCAFLLVPLIARGLSSKDLSQWALLEALLLLLPGLLTLGGHHQLLRCRMDAVAQNHTSPRSIAGGVVASALVAAVVISVPVLVVWGGVIAILFSANLFFDAVALVEQFRSRAKGDSVGYGRVTLGRAIGFLALTWLWWTSTKRLLLPELLTARLVATILVVGLKKAGLNMPHVPSAFSARFRASARYGLPIAVAASALLAGDAIERAALLAKFAAPEVASYYIHARIAAVMNLALLTPVGLAFPIIRRHILDLPYAQQHKQLKLLQTMVLGGGFIFAAMLYVAIPKILPAISPHTKPSSALAAALAMGVLMKGLGSIFGIGLFSSSGSRSVLAGAIFAILGGCTVGLILADLIGPQGMAIGSMTSGALYLLWISYRSWKIKKIGIGYRPLALLVSIPAFFVCTALAWK